MVLGATFGCQQPAGSQPAGAIMKTFIQVSEIWVPSKDRTMLEFHGEVDLPRFASVAGIQMVQVQGKMCGS